LQQKEELWAICGKFCPRLLVSPERLVHRSVQGGGREEVYRAAGERGNPLWLIVWNRYVAMGDVSSPEPGCWLSATHRHRDEWG